MPILCLGEALVDLVCERPVGSLVEADAFVPHSGGAVANVAVVAARCGAEVALGGGVGDDPWGHWLIERMRSERIDLTWFAAVPGVATPLAFVTVNEAGEPDFVVYGETIATTMNSFDAALETAVVACDALFFGSNTLVGGVERRLTQRAVDLARAAGKPFVFDPNLRLGRWPEARQAIDEVRSVCEGALLVKVNRDEATHLTGDRRCRRRRRGALPARSRNTIVVTLGADGAIARGSCVADVPGVPARPIDTTGAGDVVAGVLVAALDAGGFDPAAIGPALPAAMEAAARSTEGWGAIDALPDPMPVPA